jgi:predicted DNA binding CopG/RHH family protein
MKTNPNLEDNQFLKSYENGEWHSVSSLQNEIKRYQEYATARLEKNMLVYLNLSADDFKMLKDRAKKAGIPYQTLLTNLVHQFVTSER